ncbi:MAG TPA: SGNH/GDSL hydrolase family protein [Ktedonobacterales bacterium]|nr:SGNH/GDSL hydrolase family protein [Ktedonobacterales bacterium]
MREWIGRLAEGLLGRPLVPRARRDGGGFFSRQARWVLAGAGAVVVLAAALSAIHAHGETRTATTVAHSGKTGSVAGTHAQRGAPVSPFGPLVSRGKPVFCSPSDLSVGGKNAITSGKYGDYSFWRAGVNDLPSWCAVHLGEGPSRLLVAWSSDYIFDYIAPDGMTPRDYTLSVSGDSTDGANGHWQTAVTVAGNETRVREAVIPFAGMSWVKMTVTRGQAHATQPYVTIDQIDCYDVSAGLNETTLFSGDSITVMAYNRFDGSHPTFDELMHQMDPALYPVMLDEGFGGWSSSGAAQQISTWLALNPDIHYWLLGWGTNDALNMLNPAVFHDNMQYLIDAIKAAGHVPVLARIPAMHLPGDRGAATDAEIRALNAQIDALTQANHLISGPDLYTLVSQRPTTYLLDDGIHPAPAGAAAMNNAWYLAMRGALKASAT